MLEILIVYLIGKKVASMADYRGFSPGARAGFVIMAVAMWFGGEIFGGFLAIALRRGHTENMLAVYGFALAGAIIGAVTACTIVALLPDQGRRRKKKKRRRDYDEEDDRPKRRRRREDDYEDAAPRRRRREDPDESDDEDQDGELTDKRAPSVPVAAAPTSIRVRCPSCSKELRIGAASMGKMIRCPACQNVMRAPEPQADSRVRAAPPRAAPPPVPRQSDVRRRSEQ